MTIANRLAKIEDHIAGRRRDAQPHSIEHWRQFWDQHLPKLTDEQLDRLEVLYLKIIELYDVEEREGRAPIVGAPTDELYTRCDLLPESERAEFIAIFAAMGMDIEGKLLEVRR